jgi:hypothetical protein
MAGNLGRKLLSKGMFRNQPKRTIRLAPTTSKTARFAYVRKKIRKRVFDSDFIHSHFQGFHDYQE